MQKTLQHRTIEDNWKNLSLVQQMANIGSEVERAIKWKEKDNHKFSQKAFFRAIELFDLTLASTKQLPALTEVSRSKELFADFFFGDNQYSATKESWQKYFKAFNYLARKNT